MRQLLLAGVASVLVTGCAVTPSPLPESAIPEVPSGWRETAQGEVPVSAAWWQAYGDPHLTTAVEAALAGNVDIAVAEARVREAEALAVQARAALLPSLDLAVGGQLARSLSAFGTPSEAGSGSAQLQAAYEVDLWGRSATATRPQGPAYRPAATVGTRSTSRSRLQRLEPILPCCRWTPSWRSHAVPWLRVTKLYASRPAAPRSARPRDWN